MKRPHLNLIYSTGVIVIIGLAIVWYQYEHRREVATHAPIATSTTPTMSEADSGYSANLALVNLNCAKYYESAGQGPDPISNELADFTNLHPLSDFLCGKYSDDVSMTLADGKVLHFVNIATFECGSGGCTYYPLLEEKKGLVRHIQGFAGQDAGDSVFGFPSIDPIRHTVSIYWHESAQCGTTSTYTFNSKDEPVLISTKDTCSQVK